MIYLRAPPITVYVSDTVGGFQGVCACLSHACALICVCKRERVRVLNHKIQGSVLGQVNDAVVVIFFNHITLGYTIV